MIDFPSLALLIGLQRGLTVELLESQERFTLVTFLRLAEIGFSGSFVPLRRCCVGHSSFKVFVLPKFSRSVPQKSYLVPLVTFWPRLTVI